MTVRVLAALCALAMPAAAAAQVSTGTPSALLLFPLIAVADGGTATDTLVQLTNVDDEARQVTCSYEDPSAGPGFTSFAVRLLADQPVAWRVSEGRAAVPGDGGTIPAVPGSFTGVLRCVVVDADGAPSDQNALVGVATLQHSAPTSVDSAAYPATGFDAVAGALNADRQLVLGGPEPEYAPCPATVTVEALLDGARFALGAEAAVSREATGTLVLATCGARDGAPTSSAMVITLINEFGQLSQFVRTMHDQLVVPLSQIDTDMPARSAFRASVQGTLTGAVRISPQPNSGGVLALAIQEFAAPGSGAERHTAALTSRVSGVRSAADLVDLVAPPTPTAPPTCGGDCTGDGSVVINELIAAVNVALGNQPLSACTAADTNGDGAVLINELIAAVNHALTGC